MNGYLATYSLLMFLCSLLLILSCSYIANNMDPDQTAPHNIVFHEKKSPWKNLVWSSFECMQQTRNADNILRKALLLLKLLPTF